jgi:quinol monooxygenase YgiN
MGGGIDGQVSWVLQCAVKDGQLDAFKELMEEMVAGTSEEPGTLNYEWFISEDGATVHIYEKYADSEATIKHVNGFMEKWARRFMDCVEVSGFTTYGNPDAACHEIIAPFGGKLLGTWGGFAR